MITLGKLNITKEDIQTDMAVLEDMSEFGEDYVIRLLMLILSNKIDATHRVPYTVVGQFEADRLKEKYEKLRKALDYSTEMNIEQIKIVLDQD